MNGSQSQSQSNNLYEYLTNRIAFINGEEAIANFCKDMKIRLTDCKFANVISTNKCLKKIALNLQERPKWCTICAGCICDACFETGRLLDSGFCLSCALKDRNLTQLACSKCGGTDLYLYGSTSNVYCNSCTCFFTLNQSFSSNSIKDRKSIKYTHPDPSIIKK